MKIEWLENVQEENDVVYPLDRIDVRYERRELTPSVWLILNWDANKLWLKFAVLEFYCSEGDGKNTMLSCVFHGEGPVGNLRECRHTYWGNDGYLFYPNGKAITSGIQALSEFFDID